MNRIGYIILILALSMLVSTLHSQTIEALKKEQDKMEADIAYTNKLLSQTGSKTKSSLSQLRLLNRKIKQQEKLIKGIKVEIELLESELAYKDADIVKLENEIEQLKSEYSRIIRSMYKNKHDFDNWLFIFSSKDFNQAYRRLKYLEQYSSYRKQQVKLIHDKDSILRLEVDSINLLKEGKTQSLIKLQVEKQELAKNKQDESKIYRNLKSRQKELKRELEKKRKEAAEIKKMMEKVLEAERKKRKNKYSLTPEEELISNDFANNLGKIPWPTEKGIVISPYGEHPHPVLKGIKVLNTGVDISTEEGSKVRTIFEGEVRDIWSIKGKNMAVIIKHGDYYSVYQNLVDVQVKIGDKVKTKQTIGTVYTDKQEGDNTVLHFEIWKGAERQNPEIWIAY